MCIRYNFYWNLQFLNNVIIHKTKVLPLRHMWPYTTLAILFRSYGFIGLKNVNYFFTLSVPDEGYSRNASCTLNLISTFLCGLFQSTSTSTLYFTIYYLVKYVSNCIMILSSMTNKLRNFFRNQFLSTKNSKILQDH